MQDLSHLSKGWPSYGASMAAGSTIDNEAPWGKAPGSESEQTELAAQGVGIQGSVSPDLSFAPDQSGQAAEGNRQPRHGTSCTPGPIAWKTVKLWPK